MKTVRRLLYRDIGGSVLFVAVAFLCLFFFIDFVDELSREAKAPGALRYATLAAALQLPGNLYELMAIAVLIGTIYALSRMAQASEFTILRTAGLGPGRALALLMLPGAVCGAAAFAVGEWLVPWAERQAVVLNSGRSGGALPLGQAGAWLKDQAGTSAAARHAAVHVGAAGVDGQLLRVRIFEFDGDNRLLRRVEAAQAQVEASGVWRLSQVRIADWPQAEAASSSPAPSVGAGQGAAGGTVDAVTTRQVSTLQWQSTLNAAVVAAAVMPLQTMSTVELWRYSRHLARQEQAAQRYEIQFWKRALYPLACIVMAALALPFAYLHARAGGVSLKVFGGVMLGISFILLNNLAGHVGVLRNWDPLWAAASPSLFYLGLSLAAFSWLVRHR
jgi:lipopolysaccharide export system permease protein